MIDERQQAIKRWRQADRHARLQDARVGLKAPTSSPLRWVGGFSDSR